MDTIDRPIIFCDVVGHRRFLEVCTCFCDRRVRDGPLNEAYSECSVAISKYKCPVVIQLYPKKWGKHAHNVIEARDASNCGVSTRTAINGGTDTPKSSGMRSGNGQKEKTVHKKQRAGVSDVLPPLRKQRVPKNK